MGQGSSLGGVVGVEPFEPDPQYFSLDIRCGDSLGSLWAPEAIPDELFAAVDDWVQKFGESKTVLKKRKSFPGIEIALYSGYPFSSVFQNEKVPFLICRILQAVLQKGINLHAGFDIASGHPLILFKKNSEDECLVENVICLSLDESDLMTVSMLNKSHLPYIAAEIPEIISNRSGVVQKEIRTKNSISWKTKGSLWATFDEKELAKSIELYMDMIRYLAEKFCYLGAFHSSTNDSAPSSVYFAESKGRPPKSRNISCVALMSNDRLGLFNFGEETIDEGLLKMNGPKEFN
jgi:hypothetical protein